MSHPRLPHNHIRLLRLNPVLSDPNIGSLEATPISEAPPYYALSHSWGTQIQDVTVQVDGQSVVVSPDLAAGLQRLRELAGESSNLQPRLDTIWIDNLCINQRDLPELASQVQMMGKIYSKAIRTLIWLGPDSGSTSLAWSLLDRIYAVFRSQTPSARRLEDIPGHLFSQIAHDASGLPPLDDEQWVRLKDLLRVRWFSRIWVIQEVVLSLEDPIIVYGRHVYPWGRLGWAAAWLRRKGYFRLPQIPPEIRSVDTICLFRRPQQKWPIDALMSYTQIKFHASDQRDKVYGLLGLAAECQDDASFPEALRPDYNIDVAELYAKVGRYLLESGSSLAITTRCRGTSGSLTRQGRRHELPRLPPWSPDWSDFRVFNDRIRTSFAWIDRSGSSTSVTLGYPTQYRASAGLGVKLHPEGKDPSSLRVSGFRVDEVTRAIPFNTEMLKMDEFWPQFAARYSLVTEAAISGVLNEEIEDWAVSFIKTTTAEQHRLAGRSYEQSIRDGLAYLRQHVLQNDSQLSLFNLKSRSQDGLDLLRRLSKNGDPEEYEALARNFCFSRCFFITASGRMGTGPSDTQVGDTISVILGGGVPYIARRKLDDKGGWVFVG
ncbi:hypothetical protein CPLU01_11639 [Colletotrichum plurivorum]|uniref:Heterokaryon incompatibility domain-containing protein n=1 Tax=Colletotrichum plurivorum TaxID=2175906 RepID=A0A8H6K1I6_9PEZI|nr:hypothetical protein CPLU01_11639 [Colletotrichum plurivorum]